MLTATLNADVTYVAVDELRLNSGECSLSTGASACSVFSVFCFVAFTDV